MHSAQIESAQEYDAADKNNLKKIKAFKLIKEH